MEFWDQIVAAEDWLASTEEDRKRPERIVADVEISAGYMHSGYPIMIPTSAAPEMVTFGRIKFPGWGFYHEIGHNHQRGTFTFDGTGEVTNNVIGMYCYHEVLKKDWLIGHSNITEEARKDHLKKIKDAGDKWATWKSDPFLALTTYIQLMQEFGWESWRKYLYSFSDSSFHSVNVGGRQCVGVRACPPPDHMGHREVDEGHPKHREHQQRRELDTFRKGPDDQRRRDAGKGHLEHNKRVFRNVDIVGEGRRNRGCINALQEQFGKAADEGRAARKGEGVAPADPDKGRDRYDHEDLHEEAQHVLRADKTAVEQGERRDRHEQHERRRNEHPGGVALVDHAGHLFSSWRLDRPVLRKGRGSREHRRGPCNPFVESGHMSPAFR